MEIDDEDGETLPVVYTSSQAQTPAVEVADTDKSVQLYHPKACSPNELAQNIQSINETHTTIFAPSPQVILPSDSKGNINMNFNAFNMNSEEGQMAYSDQSRLHIILPAKEINVLNPSQKNQYDSDYGHDKQRLDNFEEYIEIGCKIDSVEYSLRSKKNEKL